MIETMIPRVSWMCLPSVMDKVWPSDCACLIRTAATRAAAPPPMATMSERRKNQLFESDCWLFIVEVEVEVEVKRARACGGCRARIGTIFVEMLLEGGEEKDSTALRWR